MEPSGEVVVSELVHAQVAQTGEFALEQPRHVELEGIEAPQSVYPLAIEASEPMATVD